MPHCDGRGYVRTQITDVQGLALTISLCRLPDHYILELYMEYDIIYIIIYTAAL